VPALLIALTLAAQIGLPAYFARALWRGREQTQAVWWLKAASSSAFVMFVFLAGRWDFLTYYLRFVVVALFALAAFRGYRRARRLPWLVNGRAADVTRPAGNHVVIACAMKGADVVSGALLGRVGNSGNTSEPHLHVHAVARDGDVMSGEGVPIVFGGVFAVRNTILRR